MNFIDVYKRTGLYPVALPATLGEEGAGTVVAVGPDFLTRPTLGQYVAARDELLGRAEAHAALEGRRTTGKVLLRIGR